MDKHTFGYEHDGSFVEWDVTDIWEAAEKIRPVKKRLQPLLEQIRSAHEDYDDDDFKRVEEADLSYPPILSPGGHLILDGVHRLYKHKQLGHEWIYVKILAKMPLPAYLGGKPFKIKGLEFEWRVKKEPMFLYHYSTESRTELLARIQSGRLSGSEILKAKQEAADYGRVGSYLEHISFFFEPIPQDIGTLYAKHNHPVWKKGMVLYEHVIDVSTLKFAFEIVETPLSQQYIDDNWRDEYMDDANEDKFISFCVKKARLLEKNGYVVKDTDYNSELLRDNSAPFIGKTRDFYLLSLKKSDPDNLSRQYATAVPHVMLYPENGKITSIVSVKQFIVK